MKKIKKLKTAFTFSVMALVSVDVFAGASEGKVSLPATNQYGVFFFSTGTHLNKPPCHTMTGGWGDSWAVDLKTSFGKSMQAIVLTAYSQGKKVHVEGKGTCDAWNDRESVDWLNIVD